MKFRAVFAGLVFAFAASLVAGPRVLPSRPALSSPQPASPAAGRGFVADKGKFRIMQQSSEAGTEEFDIAPSGNVWLARGDAGGLGGVNDFRSSVQGSISARKRGTEPLYCPKTGWGAEWG